MKQFGSLKRLRSATVDELTAVPGIGRRTAEAVLAAVAEPAADGGGADEAGVDDPGAAAALSGVRGAAAGETAEIGRVVPTAGGGS
jgi:excinuclease ABC subunit C